MSASTICITTSFATDYLNIGTKIRMRRFDHEGQYLPMAPMFARLHLTQVRRYAWYPGGWCLHRRITSGGQSTEIVWLMGRQMHFIVGRKRIRGQRRRTCSLGQGQRTLRNWSKLE